MAIEGPGHLELPDFAGKLVAFYISSGGNGDGTSVLMEYVEPRQIAGRLFLIGRMPEGSDSQWAAKLQSGVAWESVNHYIIFDSHEDYQPRAALGRPSLWARLFGRRGG